jgi:putative two-component system response regulator
VMEQHTEIGRDLLGDSGSELLELAATVAWTHHERWDGSGYPRGLRGEEIPLAGRIVAVADVFDALSSDRPYRPRLSLGEAQAWIVEGSGRAFDPDIVEAFVLSMDLVAA